MGQLEHNQATLRESMFNMRTQMGQLMEAIQAVAKGQEVMARSQEELRQAALRTTDKILLYHLQ